MIQSRQHSAFPFENFSNSTRSWGLILQLLQLILLGVHMKLVLVAFQAFVTALEHCTLEHFSFRITRT